MRTENRIVRRPRRRVILVSSQWDEVLKDLFNVTPTVLSPQVLPFNRSPADSVIVGVGCRAIELRGQPSDLQIRTLDGWLVPNLEAYL
jgi:hypothetical protein